MVTSLLALVLALSGGNLPEESSRVAVPITVSDATCPFVLHGARLAGAAAGKSRIVYTIKNPKQQNAEALVVTAAVVGPDGRVRLIQVMPVLKSVAPRSTSEYAADFERIDLQDGEHLVVGIQGVVWDKRHTWHGALPLARAAEANVLSTSR